MKRVVLVVMAWAAATWGAPSIHPHIELVDEAGQNVINNNTPVSTMKTCGRCHDTPYITSHSYHVKAIAPPGVTVAATQPSTQPSTQPVAMEMNCFLCHIPKPSDELARAEIAGGRGQWAATATLAGTKIVKKTDQGWQWNKTQFEKDGTAGMRFPRPRAATGENCGLCHGQVATAKETVTLKALAGNTQTNATGQIFSGQLLSASGLNLADKEKLTFAFNVHAQKGLDCVNCHNSINNPSYFDEPGVKRPEHLKFDARRLSPTEFMRTPSHDFAAGNVPQGHLPRELRGTMRRCEGCHDPAVTHAWLPQRERHLERINCESCHVPKVYGPARQSVDATVVTADGQFVESKRGMKGDVIEGYEPALLERVELDGTTRLTPCNLITMWYWADGAGKRLEDELVRRAYLDGGKYAGEVMALLDENKDGSISSEELRLNTPAKVAAIAARLKALGAGDARIVGEVQPYSLHHAVVEGKLATRACDSCHGGSRLSSAVTLAGCAPGGVMPVLAKNVNVRFDGRIAANASGELVYEPRAKGMYVIGLSRLPAIDVVGIIVLGLACLGVVIHGGMRILGLGRETR